MDALLDKEISRSRRQHSPVALLLVDVEKSLMAETKRVTGSSADMIIKETAQRIRRCVRDHDIVGRISNTRFLVCLTNCTIEMCSVLTQRILRTIAIEPLKLEAGTIRLSALIGCTSNEGTDVWSSTRLQDTVLQALGEAGKGNKTNNFYLVKPQI